MDAEKIFDQLTSKGDIAAACAGFAAGFMVDAFLFPDGVPPGTTAGVFAVGSLGLKNMVESAMQQAVRRQRGRRRDAKEFRERVTLLIEALEEEGSGEGSVKLRRTLALWERGILTKEHLKEDILDGAATLRLERSHASSPISLAPFKGLAAANPGPQADA